MNEQARQEVPQRGRQGGAAGPIRWPTRSRWPRTTAFAKFDETLEIAMRLGVDPKHADQMVRGTVVLPHGTRQDGCASWCSPPGEKIKEAEEAGADFVGGEELAKKIEGGWLDFDAVVATPDMMRVVGRLGHVLGPRGLMPNPKTGTVTADVAKAITEIKAGKVEFRVDKTGIVQAPSARRRSAPSSSQENAEALIHAVLQGQAGGGQGQVREVGDHLVDHGSRASASTRTRSTMARGVRRAPWR